MGSIIFDFDGTIADSLPVILQLFYKWSKREPFSKTETEALRDMPAREVIKAVGVPLWRAPALLARGRKDFTKHITEIKVFVGMPETIAELHSRGHKLYLMSSNSQHNVHEYLKLHKIDHYFTQIYGNVGLFSKARVMRRIVRQNRLKGSDTFSIGDETRDIDAAKKAGLISVAVTWGFNSEKILKEHHPNYVVSRPKDILNLVIPA